MIEREHIAVEDAVKNWQRCRQEDLPRAFYAYDDEECQSERVVTYRIGREDMEDLISNVVTNEEGMPTKDFHFKIHLGLRKDLLTDEIPEYPAFTLFMQALNHYPAKGQQLCADDYAGSVELIWEKNSRFSETMGEGTESDKNALSAAGAYLFIHSWMELPEEVLAEPFTAVSKVLGKRVRSYRFAEAESASIYQDILNSLKSDAPMLDVHMGNGMAVWQHPFSFRPVIEVKDVLKNAESPRMAGINSTANSEGDTFYDFGGPEPPPKEL
ncbi:hypothetical protein FUA23_00135 [Neolewinella aurantiaca]|uniref:Uncharacterized protein n=1 Tax=Neolewinella aurantiaca TaxID=2602767 RepID=A0A5C7FJW1_9BACT|nr:hypothetical protein [Neolewinella aurantiaca]TXF91628.1 hypothetical protein FUA23_00135 [Neolewinella aurantiaca]